MLTALAAVALSVSLVAGGGYVEQTRGCDATSGANGACSSTDGARLTITGTQQKQGSPPSRSTPGDEGPSAPRTPSPRSIALAKCLDDGGTTRCADLLRPTA